jgi:hypothetical protein
MLAFVLFGSGCLVANDDYSYAEIEMPDGVYISVDVADSPEEREQGLSGREDIGDGMLFCFQDEEIRSFWMFDMRVPLDVVWIRDNEIIGVESNISIMTGDIFGEIGGVFVHADSTWTQFASPGAADALLELPAGSVEVNGYEIDQYVDVSSHCINAN